MELARLMDLCLRFGGWPASSGERGWPWRMSTLTSNPPESPTTLDAGNGGTLRCTRHSPHLQHDWL
jgi:hypothetical protein